MNYYLVNTDGEVFRSNEDKIHEHAIRHLAGYRADAEHTTSNLYQDERCTMAGPTKQNAYNALASVLFEKVVYGPAIIATSPQSLIGRYLESQI